MLPHFAEKSPPDMQGKEVAEWCTKWRHHTSLPSLFHQAHPDWDIHRIRDRHSYSACLPTDYGLPHQLLQVQEPLTNVAESTDSSLWKTTWLVYRPTYSALLVQVPQNWDWLNLCSSCPAGQPHDEDGSCMTCPLPFNRSKTIPIGRHF